MDHFRAQCFVSVARHLSISKAAEELFVTQPAMTAQIKKLEGELGSDLFIRDGGRMILTPAGKEILGLLEEYLEVAEEVDRKLDVLRSNAKKKLAIGFHGPMGWAGIAQLVGAFADDHADAEFEMVEGTWDVLLDRVNSHCLDAAFVVSSEFEKRGGMGYYDLFREGLCAVLPASHPLAAKESVTVAELVDGTIITVNPRLMPSYLKQSDRQMVRDGLGPKRGSVGNSFGATLTLVAANQGIAFVPRSFKVPSELVAYRDLDEDGSDIIVSLVWRKANKNPLLPLFAEFCRTWSWGISNAGCTALWTASE